MQFITCIRTNNYLNLQNAFKVDEDSQNNTIASIGRKFRSFKHHLTKDYIMPYKDDPEHLKEPLPCYNYIETQIWRKLVMDRLSKQFQKKSENQKRKRSLNTYSHRLSRKCYANFEQEVVSRTCFHLYIYFYFYAWLSRRKFNIVVIIYNDCVM